MSEILDTIAASVAERIAYTGDPVRHLRLNQTFTAEIDGSPDALTVASELGEDYRNVILLHVTDDNQAATINQGELVQFRLFGRLIKAKILKRRDNGANVQTDFWAMQLTGKDQP